MNRHPYFVRIVFTPKLLVVISEFNITSNFKNAEFAKEWVTIASHTNLIVSDSIKEKISYLVIV